jgi:hypothetical protein
MSFGCLLGVSFGGKVQLIFKKNFKPKNFLFFQNHIMFSKTITSKSCLVLKDIYFSRRSSSAFPGKKSEKIFPHQAPETLPV